MGTGTFWVGVAAGVLATYLYLNHGDEWVSSFMNWFDGAASSFKDDDSRREADRILQ